MPLYPRQAPVSNLQPSLRRTLAPLALTALYFTLSHDDGTRFFLMGQTCCKLIEREEKDWRETIDGIGFTTSK